MRYVFEKITTLKNLPALNLLFSLLTVKAFAQKEVIKEGQNLLWARYHLTWNCSDKWAWVNEVDNRVFISNFHNAQLIAHSHLHYKISNETEASIGITYSQTNPVDPETKNPLSVPEIRPFQEYYLKQKMSKKFGIQHRFRLEERFFRNNNGQELVAGLNFNMRYRYQLALNYLANKNFTIKAVEELFVNSGKNIVYNTFDSNRLYFALNYKICKGFSTELGYLKSIQQTRNGKTYVDRNNIRFTIYHTIRNRSKTDKS